MFILAVVTLLIAVVFTIIRAIAGPTMFDRVLAANVLGTLAVLLLAAIGFAAGRPEWLDIALTYGLLNLIATLAALKYFRHGDMAYAGKED